MKLKKNLYCVWQMQERKQKPWQLIHKLFGDIPFSVNRSLIRQTRLVNTFNAIQLKEDKDTLRLAYKIICDFISIK